MTSTIHRVHQISTLISRRCTAREYDDLNLEVQAYLQKLVRGLSKSTNAYDVHQSLHQVLQYLAGVGAKEDIRWLAQQVIETAPRLRSKKLPGRKASATVFSSGTPDLQRGLLARDTLRSLFTKAYEETKKAKAQKIDPFAWGLKTSGFTELAHRMQQVWPIFHTFVRKERWTDSWIGGEDSHVDFSNFAAGYGATPRDLYKLNSRDLKGPKWFQRDEPIPTNAPFIVRLIGQWQALRMPETDDAFNQGFILSMLK